ncbi:uncharacterized protein LOC117475359 [Trematomus bernacchii]|uniref:uncharacterized protein LOC117475359 n=1 Tax=Trematomus bernacchii TaxID=40690 RepID=UPI00146F5F6E|nr:uncharacterized protein LOC117475359 [Trematomus bernacchii]
MSVKKHNEEVDTNRHVLSKIIDCVKFCGGFDLALRGHDETDTSDNPGVFLGLVNLLASLDSVLEDHLKTATVFKGTSKTVQNELLDCMLSVCKDYILEENANADTVATALMERLGTILPDGQQGKLIAQAYDGVQRSFKRTAILDQVVAHRLPGTSTTRWNFHSRAVNTAYEHKENILRCFQTIRDSGDFDPITVREAGGFVRMMEDEVFCFFLTLFHKIMPHVDMLFSQLQKRNIDSVYITGLIKRFTSSIQTIRDSIPSGESSGSQQLPTKKRRGLGHEEQQLLAREVCDTILSHAKERFSFTKHLISSTLLQGDLFQQHSRTFPEAALETTVEAYPLLDKAKLKTELSLVYDNDQFRACSGAVTLLQFFIDNNLQETFTETVSLLKVLVTTPMATAEAERCFSTLKRIKTFLRNSMTQDRLNALAMLSIEKKLIRSIPDFNTRVIERFATQKERRAKFLYK